MNLCPARLHSAGGVVEDEGRMVDVGRKHVAGLLLDTVGGGEEADLYCEDSEFHDWLLSLLKLSNRVMFGW